MNISLLYRQKDIIIVNTTGYLYARTCLDQLFSSMEEFKSFETIEEIYQSIKKSKNLIVIFNNDISFEDELSISRYLTDPSVVKKVLEGELLNKSTINEDMIFHFSKQKREAGNEYVKYFLYGFKEKKFKEVISTIPNFINVETVTSMQYLFYNFCKRELNHAFIAIYKLGNEEIMVASDVEELIFSRVHPTDIKREEVLKSIDYLLQRFPDILFTIYISSLDKSLQQHIAERFTINIELIKEKNKVVLFKGLRKLPKILNFVPRDLRVKRYYSQVKDFFFLASIGIFFIVSLMFFTSIAKYNALATEYNKSEKLYKSTLKSMNLVSDKKLIRTLAIHRFQSHHELKDLKKLLLTTQILFSKMKTINFQFDAQNSRKAIAIKLSKTFSNLKSMDSFLIQLEKELKIIKNKLPNITFKKVLNFKTYTVLIAMESKTKRSSLRRSRRDYQ
jgi:hypothetical protein